jgi:hypothetical protein
MGKQVYLNLLLLKLVWTHLFFVLEQKMHPELYFEQLSRQGEVGHHTQLQDNLKSETGPVTTDFEIHRP